MKTLKPALVLAGLACLLVLTLGCATQTSGEVWPPATPAKTALDDNATSGAIVRSTRQAQATKDSQSTATQQAAELAGQATQTAQAEMDATATVVARATGQAVLAAKSTWPRVLAETFKNNDLAWPIGLTKDDFLSVDSVIADGHYSWKVIIASGNSYFNLMPKKGPKLTDFYAQVNVQFGAGNVDNQNAYGLSFRHSKDDYGFFGILQSGSFRVLEVHHTGVYTWLQSSSSGIDTRSGQVNRIAVVGVGPDFVLLINDQVVEQMNAELDPGQVGLGVDSVTKADQAEVAFSSLEIYAP